MDRELKIMLGAVTVFLVTVFVVVALLDRWACHSRWERSGMGYDWGLIQGCLVKMPNGAWIPEDRYREIDR